MVSVDVLTFGETMVSLRSAGPLAQGGSLAMHAAGAESNVAVGLARLGHPVRWAGRLGCDPHGDFVERALRAEGVDLAVGRDPVRPTGVMFLERRTADVNRAWYYRSGSAGSGLSRADVEGPLEDGARILHLTGITPALSAKALDAFAFAAETAAARGIVVSLDVNYRGKLWSREEARAALAPVARHAAVVIASDDELDLLVPRRATDGVAGTAAELLGLGVRDVVVKLGARGAEAYTAAGTSRAGAVAVDAVDTVGAGDAFSAGYLSGLLEGGDVAARLRRGALMGAFAVSTAGDWEGLPQRHELGLLDATESGATDR
ncbi:MULTISPECIES: sugar kinase [unclassified Arthrobacter]|uniref:sugar kinase n=1 Tax=unclassified Arthrobacter TaxID=235627 RepID=UPI00159D4457|nr:MULTISPECIES: sugar kinase [unclassified Arthrobacter]MCQ9162661.1 sugar kinase [Arthrobacter sp. STN4]NVM97356.1 sugar kinase [Arthrobacter sp. SDTb3-6]